MLKPKMPKLFHKRKPIIKKSVKRRVTRFGRPIKANPIALRRRFGIDIIEPKNEADYYESLKIPSCNHGKCLLFKKPTDEGGVERWFGCALHRTRACLYRFDWPKDDVVNASSNVKSKSLPVRSFLPDKIIKINNEKSDEKFWFCLKCVDVFPEPTHYHELEGPFTKFSDLFGFVPAMEHEESQAQFWFAQDSMDILYESSKNAGIDSFVCVGTPYFFQHLLNKGEKAYLLDIDERFRAFFSNDQFAIYNMVNNEFHTSATGFIEFMKKAKNVTIICDPPFATFIKALAASLKSLSEPYKKKVHFTFTLPFFMDKHLNREFPEIKMVDCPILYQNHQKFRFPKKSPVRFFTTINRKHFVLKERCYRYCGPCDRYVFEANIHCSICNCCPSRDGHPTRHCEKCQRCVPAKYNHCRQCNKCSLNGRCHDMSLRIQRDEEETEE